MLCFSFYCLAVREAASRKTAERNRDHFAENNKDRQIKMKASQKNANGCCWIVNITPNISTRRTPDRLYSKCLQPIRTFDKTFFPQSGFLRSGFFTHPPPNVTLLISLICLLSFLYIPRSCVFTNIFITPNFLIDYLEEEQTGSSAFGGIAKSQNVLLFRFWLGRFRSWVVFTFFKNEIV